MQFYALQYNVYVLIYKKTNSIQYTLQNYMPNMVIQSTLPETNIAPGSGWLEYDRFLLGWPIFFRRELLVSGRVTHISISQSCFKPFISSNHNQRSLGVKTFCLFETIGTKGGRCLGQMIHLKIYGLFVTKWR